MLKNPATPNPQNTKPKPKTWHFYLASTQKCCDEESLFLKFKRGVGKDMKSSNKVSLPLQQ